MLSALGVLSFCVAGAAEYYWVPGATDWTSSASYANADGSAAGCVPTENDELAIPENCTVTLDCDNAEHFAIANKLARVRPLTESSYFVVKVSEGKEVTFNPMINYLGNGSYDEWYRGGLIKRGLGTLILGSGSNAHAYFTDITVEEGTLKLPQNAPNQSWRYYDLIAVSNGATLFTCSTADGITGKTMTAPLGLIGEGTVTNDCAAECFLEILGSGRIWSHEFAGRITGSILLNNGYTHFNLTGTRNTFRGIMAIRESSDEEGLQNVRIGLKRIGMKADAESSAGRNNGSYGLGFRDTCLWSRNNGSGYLYIGDGETTDKDITVHATHKSGVLPGDNPNFFDAGATGGITFTGRFQSADGNMNHRFILTGSNTSECVIAGPIKKKYDSNNAVANYNWRFIKQGTGVWRLADVANTEMEGVFAVKNGTLRYDSIAEKGTRCSLGYSTLLLEDRTGKIEDLSSVDHAFELGSATDATADPIFEYTGVGGGWCFTRPFAMKGSARLRHSGGGELRLAHLKTLNDSDKTLTLDGDGENAWIYNVCDDYGTLSLVKDGSGTWNVAGTNQVSGSVAVKEGTLNLVHHAARFSWFRWTHKSIVGAMGGAAWETVDLELGLYGHDGSRVNGGLTYFDTPVVTADDILSMPAGSVAQGCEGFLKDTSDMVRLFDSNIGNEWVTAFRPKGESTWRRSTVEDPSSWYSIVMRLPEGSKEVSSYDLISWASWSWRTNNASRAFSMEGSHDGIHWHMLHDFDAGVGATLKGQATAWRFAVDTYGNGDAACPESALLNHTKGHPISGCLVDLPPILANVTEISVAAGARLAVIDGDAIELRDGITLTVDGTTGAGTLANMILPENGTLNVVNVPEFNGSLEMSITGDNVTGLNNISNWGLSVNGVVQNGTKYKCRYANGKIVMYRPGTVVVFR